MRRTKQRYTDFIMYAFTENIKELGDGEIENELNPVGKPFYCNKVSRTKALRNPMTGRVFDTQTEVVLKTDSQLDFKGFNYVSLKRNPTEQDLSTIIFANDKPRNNIGGKRNANPLVTWELKIS